MGLLNDILLGFTLLACTLNYNAQFAAGVANQQIACLAGRRKMSLEEFTEIEICSTDEICFVSRYLDGGQIYITAGCRSKKECKIGQCAETFYKDQIPVTEETLRIRKDSFVLCDECCHTGLCNRQLCGLVSNLSPKRRKCFDCTDQSNMNHCKTFTVCESDDFMCTTTQHYEGILNTYSLGCAHRQICAMLMNITDSVDTCCDSDLCNVIPNFENIFHGTATDNVECPKDLIPSTIANIQSGTTIRNTQSPTTIAKTQATAAIKSSQSPTAIKSTQLSATIPSRHPQDTNTKAMTGAGTIAPSPRTPTKVNTTMGVLSTIPAVASKRPPVTLPPVAKTCFVCTADSTPENCEYTNEEKQCDPPNNYCMNVITNSITGTRTVEKKCTTFDDCYSNWWQGSSDEEQCQTYVPSVSMTANFQCSFCCTEDRCNDELKPLRETLYQDN